LARDNNRNFKKEAPEFKERILRINRVSKTTTGGRAISFNVVAAVGDEKGRVGIGTGKALGVPDAIRKAIADAKKNMINVSLKGSTIPHDQIGKFGATSVLLKPAHEGTGVIAGSAAREILELVGVHNILTKIRGSKNKLNVARATIEGLRELRTAEEVAKLRGKDVKDILS
jgi:small subunit ribosomal protein S5